MAGVTGLMFGSTAIASTRLMRGLHGSTAIGLTGTAVTSGSKDIGRAKTHLNAGLLMKPPRGDTRGFRQYAQPHVPSELPRAWGYDSCKLAADYRFGRASSCGF